MRGLATTLASFDKIGGDVCGDDSLASNGWRRGFVVTQQEGLIQRQAAEVLGMVVMLVSVSRTSKRERCVFGGALFLAYQLPCLSRE